MFAANTYDIHLATEEDSPALSRLAEFDSGGPLRGPVLIGHNSGGPAAAISLADGRIVADPHRRPDQLRACLRIRAGALHAYEQTPSLAARMLAALSVADRFGCTARREGASERGPATAATTANGGTGQRAGRRRVLATS
jgi:hypothetical protein